MGRTGLGYTAWGVGPFQPVARMSPPASPTSSKWGVSAKEVGPGSPAGSSSEPTLRISESQVSFQSTGLKK